MTSYSQGIFSTYFLIARPAAGKSEIINYLMNMDATLRLEKFQIFLGPVD